MNVILSNGTMVPAFTLSGWIATAGDAYLTGTTICGNLTYVKGNFSLASSNVGPFDVTILDNLLNMLFSLGVVPGVNKILENGFLLPTIPGYCIHLPFNL